MQNLCYKNRSVVLDNCYRVILNLTIFPNFAQFVLCKLFRYCLRSWTVGPFVVTFVSLFYLFRHLVFCFSLIRKEKKKGFFVIHKLNLCWV